MGGTAATGVGNASRGAGGGTSNGTSNGATNGNIIGAAAEGIRGTTTTCSGASAQDNINTSEPTGNTGIGRGDAAS